MSAPPTKPERFVVQVESLVQPTYAPERHNVLVLPIETAHPSPGAGSIPTMKLSMQALAETDAQYSSHVA